MSTNRRDLAGQMGDGDGDGNGGGGARLTPEVAALAELAHGALGQMTATQRARGLEGLGRRMQRRARSARGRLVAMLTLTTAAGVLGALRFAGPFSPDGESPLAYKVEGGLIGPSGTIEPVGGSQPTVRFDDGSAVKLAPGARGRLTSVDRRGARFAIDRGAAEVRVTPKPGSRWLFDAGPFLITVQGTVFSAGWDEAAGRLDVKLIKGRVSVTGPVGGGPIAVSGGQHLTVTLRQARVFLRDLQKEQPNDEHAGPTISQESMLGGASAPEVPASPGERPPAARVPPQRPAGKTRSERAPATWAQALAAGNLDAILVEADRDGARALATRGSGELAALAAAARYRRRDTLARAALMAQRRRFPLSLRATDAAFLLGRLEESNRGGLGESVRWYDRYLEEAPSGTYASEALGRKMVAVQKLHGTPAARAVAEEYARRFPSGTYAGAARALRDAR